MRSAYIETLSELAAKDKNVYAVISDNGAIVYDSFRELYPNQYINAGISEANMVAMSAGMASRGKIPFAYTIGAFLAYRAYEFILNDVCMQKANVKLIGIGAGCSYSLLGSSHHSIYDIAVLRPLPNLTILSPGSPKEVVKAVWAAYRHEGPVYLRLGTNREPEIYKTDYSFEIGKGVELHKGNDVTIIGTGSILKDILDVAEECIQCGIGVRVINIHTIKPMDKRIVEKAIDETGRILTVEDHNIVGGIGSAVAEIIAEYGKPVMFKRVGLKDFSHGYGSYSEVKEMNGIGKRVIKNEILRMAEI